MAKLKLSHHALIRYMGHAFGFDFAELRTYAAVWLGKASANRVADGELVNFIEETIGLGEFKMAFHRALDGTQVLHETKADIYRYVRGDLVAVIDKEKSLVKTVLPRDFLLRKARSWNLQIEPNMDVPPEASAVTVC